MTYPVWQLELGGGALIAFIAIVHVFVSHFAVGGGLFLVVTEHLAYRRNDAELLGWLRRHAKFFALLTVVFGAVTGVGIWFSIGLVHPAATSALIHIFVWGWAIEWVFFFVEIAAVLIYTQSWQRLDRKSHLAVGWIYFVSAFMSLVVINGILSFMFTPGRWPTTGSFWDAFFNPTYLPSLLVRTLACIAFAGIYVLATAWRETPSLRIRLARYATLWALPATVIGPLAAYYYFQVGAPDSWQVVQGAVPKAVAGLGATQWAAGGYALLLLAVALLAKKWPRIVSLPVGATLLLLGLASIGGAEYVRENVRKPYVIGNVSAGGLLYVNALSPRQYESSTTGGLLAAARWVAPIRASEPPSSAEHMRGHALFEIACRSCHTVNGYNAIRPLVDGRPVAAIAGALRTLHKRRGRMPPFPGNEHEVGLLARYLAGLDGEVGPLPASRSDAPKSSAARGKALLEAHCLSCHALDRDDDNAPALRPLIEDWSAEQAYETLGKLSQLSDEMYDFEGTDEERHLLAKQLAAIAKEQKEEGEPTR